MADDLYVRLPLNPGTDSVSRNVYALIFNGLSHALCAEGFTPLDERERLARAVYEALRSSGVAVRFIGLEQLRETAAAIERSKE